MQRVFILWVIILSHFELTAQVSLQWYLKNDSSSNGLIYQMKTCINGDVVIQGYNNGGDIDPGPAVNNSGIHFFARYSSNGQLIFGRPFVYSQPTSPNYTLYTDRSDNILVIFRGQGLFDFDSVPGIGEVNISNGCGIVKFDKNGNYLWNASWNLSYYFTIYRLVITHDNAIVLSGDIQTQVDLDPGTGSAFFGSSNQMSCYILKLDSMGNYSNAGVFTAPYGNYPSYNFISAYSIACDSFDNIYLACSYNYLVDVDPGPGVYQLNNVSSSSPYPKCVIKLDASFNFVYAHAFAKDCNYEPFTDDFGNYYLIGKTSYNTTTDIDPSSGVNWINPNNLFIAKFDSNGSLISVKTITTLSHGVNIWFKSLKFNSSIDQFTCVLFLADSIESNTIGLPPLLAQTASNQGPFLVAFDTSMMVSICFPLIQNLSVSQSDAVITDNNHFYYSGRLAGQSDIQVGPGITTASSVQPSPWNEYFLSYYTMDFSICRIDGKVFVDRNLNGYFDIQDYPIPNAIVNIQSGNFHVSTDNNGNYSYYVQPGNYTISMSGLPFCISNTVPPQYTISFASSNQVVSGNDFAVQPVLNTSDAAISITNINPARPGFPLRYVITYSNNGCEPINGYIESDFDSLLTFSNSTPGTSSQSGNLIGWNYSTLQLLHSASIYVNTTLTSFVQIGTPVETPVSITPLVNDINPNNNFDTSTVIVSGSFDPNDKFAFPIDYFLYTDLGTGKPIEYTIRFQNVGNDTAFNIVILDTLTKFVNPGSLKIISASHPIKFRLHPDNLMEFTFENIQLPDVNINEFLSHGFVKYSVQPYNHLKIGDVIENRAYIYFDYNVPIATNLVRNEVVLNLPTAISSNNSLSSVQLLPNPAFDFVTITGNVDAELNLEVLNVTGNKIYELKNSKPPARIDISDLPQGIYLIQIISSIGNQHHFKLAKIQK